MYIWQKFAIIYMHKYTEENCHSEDLLNFVAFYDKHDTWGPILTIVFTVSI